MQASAKTRAMLFVLCYLVFSVPNPRSLNLHASTAGEFYSTKSTLLVFKRLMTEGGCLGQSCAGGSTNERQNLHGFRSLSQSDTLKLVSQPCSESNVYGNGVWNWTTLSSVILLRLKESANAPRPCCGNKKCMRPGTLCEIFLSFVLFLFFLFFLGLSDLSFHYSLENLLHLKQYITKVSLLLDKTL